MSMISYRGHLVAIAGREEFRLAPDVAARPDGDPLKRWVCYLALYARDVLTGVLPDEPSRYFPARGERYARECLIPPREFQALTNRSDAELAAHFNVPLEQITARRADLAPPPADQRRCTGRRRSPYAVRAWPA
jgi:hypothetical protein